MPTLTFKIHGMDCAEEVSALKRTLGPLVGEAQLRFDLVNGKLLVETEGEAPAEAAILDAVGRAGLRAESWEAHTAATQAGGARPGAARAWLCAASGAAVAGGLAWHAAESGLYAALAAGEAAGVSVPWPAAALYLFATAAGGWYVAPKAWAAVRGARADMNLLMTIAVCGALLLGSWLEGALVAFLFSVANLLETWSVGRARRAITALMDLTPATARFRCPEDGDVIEKPVAEVPAGVTVLVRPGERIALDGVVSKGATSVNQSPLTGESAPVEKREGDEVFAGTINNEGAFEFRASRAASDSSLARIIRMVEEAQSRRAPSEQWVERFARYYTPAMMLFAAVAALIPPLAFGVAWTAAIYHALVLLLIACPCALVISTPVSIVAGLATAARAGVLIKGGAYLEAPARLRAVALDKTGTLTHGVPAVRRIIPLDKHNDRDLLAVAAAIESLSQHPLGQAVVRHAQEAGVPVTAADAFQAIPGKGAAAVVGGRRYWIGNLRLLRERGQDNATAIARAMELEDAGHSVVILGTDDHVCGLISVADVVRPESRDAVDALHAAGVARIVMLTGDNAGTAQGVAAACGVEAYHAELLPEDKVARMRELVARWGEAAMVGDGVNDAPAMAASSLGIAMGAVGSDAAIETADIALMSDDLMKIPWLVHHSRRTLRIIRQNVVVALGLKAVVFVLALGGIATLWLAILADMGASLAVIFNALRLLHTPTAQRPDQGR